MSILEKKEKTGGRKPGATNLITRELRETVKFALDNNAAKLNSTLASLSGSEFIAAYAKLLKFVVPDLRSVTIKEVEQPKQTFSESLEQMTVEELQALRAKITK